MSAQLKRCKIRGHLCTGLFELLDYVGDLFETVREGVGLAGSCNGADHEEGGALKEDHFFGFSDIGEAAKVVFELGEVGDEVVDYLGPRL